MTGGRRGEVTSWSAASRRRMLKTLEAIPWETLGRLAWVGLTYPQEYPQDGRVVKRHLDAWLKRWKRKFGGAVGCWKVEYQRRGAPHYHLLLTWPQGWGDADLQAWVAASWYEVCDTGDIKHLQAGTTCQPWRKKESPGSYFAGYGSKASKEYQQHPAPGYVAPGRFWGLVGIRPNWQEVPLSRRQFVQARRIVYGIRRSRVNRRTKRRYVVRKPFGLAGAWTASGRQSGVDAIRICVAVAEKEAANDA